jgi:hypothetical protein
MSFNVITVSIFNNVSERMTKDNLQQNGYMHKIEFELIVNFDMSQ